jgi:hypothetical protein
MGSLDFAARRSGVVPKPFLRLEVVSIKAIAPARDRVALLADDTAQARPALKLVHRSVVTEKPSLARPWSRLVQGLLESEEPQP